MPRGPAGGSSLNGARVGKYEILHHIATGGMAEIYLARATALEGFEKLVVIKRVLPGLARDRKFVEMFLDEARIAATLHHSNVVQVFDISEIDGEFFLVMEFLHGQNVSAILRAAKKRWSKPSLDQSLSIVIGMLGGLHYAHEKKAADGQPLGLVHRDVSPQNTIVTYDGDVKLVDFGLVKASGRLTKTRSGTLKGKLAYMSPEQCRADDADRRSDIFSISVMLWELSTGRRLFTGTCDYDYLKAIVEEDAPPPSSRVNDFPPDLERIIMKGLQRDARRRYPTCEEMQIDLEEFAREHRLAISPITLRRMMQDLFADQIQAWETLQRRRAAADEIEIDLSRLFADEKEPSGEERSSEIAPAKSDADRKATRLGSTGRRGPSRLRSRRRGLVPAALAVVALAAAVFGWAFSSGSADDLPAPSEPPRPTAAPTEPATTPAAMEGTTLAMPAPAEPPEEIVAHPERDAAPTPKAASAAGTDKAPEGSKRRRAAPASEKRRARKRARRAKTKRKPPARSKRSKESKDRRADPDALFPTP